MTQSAPRADVVIVGGGIVGCATAWHLARRGLCVQIVERGQIASEQSSRAWGFVRQQGRHAAETPLAAAASRLWETLERDLGADVEFVRGGIVLLAETEADEARMVEGERIAREHGTGSRLLTPAEIHELIPGLGLEWRTGLYTAADGHAEPVKATRAFADAAQRQGVLIATDTPAIGIEVSGGKASGVVTARGVFRGDAILCAGGIGAAELTRTLGCSLPIETVRAPVAQTNRTSYAGRVAVWSPHGAFRPKRDGSFVIGNGYRGIDAEYDLMPDSLRHVREFLPTYLAHRQIMNLRFGRPFFEALQRSLARDGRFGPWSEPAVNQHLADHNEREFHRLLPQFDNLGIARQWAGRIDATPDLIPVIGAVDAPQRYYIAAGFNGHGFALAPIVAQLLAEMIVEGKPSLDLCAFRPQRFAEGDVQHAQGAL